MKLIPLFMLSLNPWGEAVRRLKKKKSSWKNDVLQQTVATAELGWLSEYYGPKKVENQFSFRAVQCGLLMA